MTNLLNSRRRRTAIALIMACVTAVAAPLAARAETPTLPSWYSGPAAPDPLQGQLEGSLQHLVSVNLAQMTTNGCDTSAIQNAATLDKALRSAYNSMQLAYNGMNATQLADDALIGLRAVQFGTAVAGFVAALPVVTVALEAAGTAAEAAVVAGLASTIAGAISTLVQQLQTGELQNLSNGASLLQTIATALGQMKGLAAQIGAVLGPIGAAFGALSNAQSVWDDFNQAWKDADSTGAAYLDAAGLYQQALQKLKQAITAGNDAAKNCKPKPSPPDCVPSPGHSCLIANSNNTLSDTHIFTYPAKAHLTFAYCDGLTCGSPETAQCVSNLWIPGFVDSVPPNLVFQPPAPGMVALKIFINGGDGNQVTQYGYYDQNNPSDWNGSLLEGAPRADGYGAVNLPLQGSHIVSDPILAARVIGGRQCGISDEDHKAFVSQYGSEYDNQYTTIKVTIVWGYPGSSSPQPPRIPASPVQGW